MVDSGVANPIPIRIDIFERAFKRYQKAPGASFTTLAKKMRVPVAQLREWRRTGEVPIEKLELLAAALNIPSHKLVRTPDGTLLPESEGSPAYLPNKVGHNLLTVARTLRSYTKFLGYQRGHSQFPHAHTIPHPGKDAFYANLFLESSASKQSWLFSVWFGIRMDYGFVHLTRDAEVVLEPILQDQEQASTLGFAAESEDGKSIVTVRTWFGRPACDFIVHSDKPFGMRWAKQPVTIPGAVTFLKNPFQRDE